METKCPKCGKIIHSRIANYRYKESGLDNVYLENIPVYECYCGTSYASIFRLPMLNDLIGATLVKKLALLRGNEIRFLRKNIYLSSKSFANKLGVGKTTLSKWENEVQHHSEAFDRLIRATYMITKGIKGQEQIDLLKLLEKIRLKSSDNAYDIVAEKVEDGYVVSYRPALRSQAEKYINILAFHMESSSATTMRGALIANEVHTVSELEFYSDEVLSSKTYPSHLVLEV